MFCKICHSTNPDMFYKSITTHCREHWRQRVAENRLAKIDYYRSYDRMRASMPHRKAVAKRVQEQWKAKWPNRRKAQIALGNAVSRGVIVPLPCFVCGEKAEAHHPDYDAPLAVSWLCPVHHKRVHAEAMRYA